MPEPANGGLVGITESYGAGEVLGGVVGSSSVNRAKGAAVAAGVAALVQSRFSGRPVAVATAVPVSKPANGGLVVIAEGDGSGEVLRGVAGASSVDLAKGAVVAAAMAMWLVSTRVGSWLLPQRPPWKK